MQIEPDYAVDGGLNGEALTLDRHARLAATLEELRCHRIDLGGSTRRAEGGRAARRCWRCVHGGLTGDESPAENHRDGGSPPQTPSPVRAWRSSIRASLRALGVGVGAAIIFTVATLIKYTELPGSESDLTLQAMAMIIGCGIVMLGVCMLGGVVPALRALNIEPTIALGTE